MPGAHARQGPVSPGKNVEWNATCDAHQRCKLPLADHPVDNTVSRKAHILDNRAVQDVTDIEPQEALSAAGSEGNN